MFLGTQARVRQARYSSLTKSDRAGKCAEGEAPDYSYFSRWEKCFDIQRERDGLNFGVAVPWPPSSTSATVLRRKLIDSSEFKLEYKSAGLSWVETNLINSPQFYKSGSLCTACEDRLLHLGYTSVLERLENNAEEFRVKVPKLTGKEVWQCEDGSCSACAIFKTGPQPTHCKLCFWKPEPKDIQRWCEWLVEKGRFPQFLQSIEEHREKQRLQAVQRADRDVVNLASSLRAKIQQRELRARQLQRLTAGASRKGLGEGNAAAFAERCQGELIALGKRLRRDYSKGLYNLPSYLYDNKKQRNDQGLAALAAAQE